MNLLGKIGLTTLALLGGSKLFAAVKAFKVSEELNINIISPRIHKLDINPFSGGMEIRADVELQNPTNGSMTISQPFVQLYSQKSILASSDISKKDFVLKPFSKVQLDTLKFNLDWSTIFKRLFTLNSNMPKQMSLAQKIQWILKNYKQVAGQLDLAIKYSTYANGLYYSDTQKIEI